MTYVAGLPTIAISENADVTVDGFRGKHLQYTMDGAVSELDVDCAFAGISISAFDNVWILDVDGVHLLIASESDEDVPQVPRSGRLWIESTSNADDTPPGCRPAASPRAVATTLSVIVAPGRASDQKPKVCDARRYHSGPRACSSVDRSTRYRDRTSFAPECDRRRDPFAGGRCYRIARRARTQSSLVETAVLGLATWSDAVLGRADGTGASARTSTSSAA